MRIKYIGKHTPKSKKLYKYIEENHPEYINEENPELIIVAGGDGSMLHAIQDYSYFNVPFFGIGMGTLDFIMNEVSNPEISLEISVSIAFRLCVIAVFWEFNKAIFFSRLSKLIFPKLLEITELQIQ